MPKAGHIYKLGKKNEEMPELDEIQRALKKWTRKRPRDKTNKESSQRNFLHVKLTGDILEGTYQVDVRVPVRRKDGRTVVYSGVEESRFAVKPSGKIIFFGKKKWNDWFVYDICASLKSIYGLQVPDKICEKQEVSEKVMKACIKDRKMGNVIYSAFQGEFDACTFRQSVAGANLQLSPIFAELHDQGSLYRLIIRMKTAQRRMTVQITTDGLILGYGAPSIEELLEIVESLESHGL